MCTEIKKIVFQREEGLCCHSLKNDDVKTMKKNLRAKAKSEMKSYFSDVQLSMQCSKSVFDFFVSSNEYKKAPLIMAYMAMNDEIDLKPIIEKSLKDGKRVAVPKMQSDSVEMDFYYIKSIDLSFEGFEKDKKYGILEPSVNSFDFQKVDFSLLPENTVVLVPGLAFNLEGARLGRGKGFYDRYLSKVLQFNGHKNIIFCGVCPVNVITRLIPVDKNDIKMTHLLNEYGFISVCR